MPNLSMGPGVRQALTWIMILSSLALGFWSGWNSRGSWGLQTELAVHIADSEVMREAAEWLFNEELRVTTELERIDVKSIHECGRMSMRDVLRTSQKPD